MISKLRKKVQKLRRLLRDEAPAGNNSVYPGPKVVPLDSIQAARLLFFDRLIARTKDVPGDIVECGVGGGTSILLMAHIVHILQVPKALWGFDSFEGFPEPTAEDARAVEKGAWALPKQQAEALLRAHLNDELFFRSKIILIKGFFEHSLTVHQGPISLLNLDVDLYQSYKTCLEMLYPKVSPGGIIVFDEYHREGDVWPGAPKAIDEFFAGKRVEFARDQIWGKFFVVKPRESPDLRTQR